MHQAILGLGLLQLWEDNKVPKFRSLALKTGVDLLKSGVQTRKGALAFPTSVQVLGYKLPSYWNSALTQSLVSNLFLRLSAFSSDSWLKHAGLTMDLLAELPELRTISNSRGNWFEEYPSRPPLHVLNGHMYTLICLFELWKSESDPSVFSLFTEGAQALIDRLPLFDCGGLSYYDGVRRILAKPYYQRLHVTLLRVLHAYTGEARFSEFSTLWNNGFRQRWGFDAWASYATRTIKQGIRYEGWKYPPRAMSYALGDIGISIEHRL